MQENAQTSPPTARVVAVISLLKSDPGRPRKLNEITQSLDLNRATCLAILTELCRAGWVVRDRRTKHYTLGRALVDIGRAAETVDQVLRIARQALHSLEIEPLLSNAQLIARDHDALVVLDSIGADPDGATSIARVLPLVPPIGVGFMAWSTDEDVEQWFDRSDEPMTSEDRRWFADLFDSVRQSGFVITRLNSQTTSVSQLLSDVSARSDGSTRAALGTVRRHLLRDAHVLDPQREAHLRVVAVTSPIFDEHARPVHIISCRPRAVDARPADVLRLGTLLARLSVRVTDEAGGVLPADFPHS